MSETKLRVVAPSVKVPGTQNGERRAPEMTPEWRTRSLPYWQLETIANCRRLPLSAASRVLLMELLAGMGRQGRGEGCRSAESMDVRRDEQLLKTMKCSRASLKRQKQELRRAKLLRIVRVEARCPLPDFRGSGEAFTSRPAADGRTSSVYYVDVDEVLRMVGVAPRQRPVEIRKAGSPAALSKGAPFLHGVDESDALEAHWYARIGQARGALPETRKLVQKALRIALASHSPDILRDVIDGRADRKLGGDQFDFCERHDLWDDRLFASKKTKEPSVIIERLGREVAKNRERQQRARTNQKSRSLESSADQASAEYVAAHMASERSRLPWLR